MKRNQINSRDEKNENPNVKPTIHEKIFSSEQVTLCY